MDAITNILITAALGGLIGIIVGLVEKKRGVRK